MELYGDSAPARGRVILSLCIIVRNAHKQIYIYIYLSIFIHRKRRVSLYVYALLFSGGNIIYMYCDGGDHGKGGKRYGYIYIYIYYMWNSGGMCHPDTGNAPKVLRILARDNMRVDRRRKRKRRAFFLLYIIYIVLSRARTHKLTLTSHNWPDTTITQELPWLAYVRIYIHSGAKDFKLDIYV